MKTNRALFSIKQGIFDKSIKPSSVLHIFDALVKPIALYNAEIWAAYKSCYKSKTLEDKVNIRFCKYVLGVNSKACNFAVISELGQFPMLISILTSCINFWLHTIQSNKDSLISKAYQEQMNDSGVKCMWLQSVKNILFDLGFSHVWANQSTFNPSALLYSIKTKLKEKFISFWKKTIVI